MAQSVHLVLEAGDETIRGHSTVTSHGREHTIECVAYSESSSFGEDGASLDEISFDKRIDVASPRLSRALFEAEELDATFRFYRATEIGDGVEPYFTVTLSGARILEIRRVSPDSTDPGDASRPALERVVLGSASAAWSCGEGRYEAGGS